MAIKRNEITAVKQHDNVESQCAPAFFNHDTDNLVLNAVETATAFAAPAYVAPSIDFFNDNVGARQGDFKSGANTDDARPTLYGHGTPGATLQLMYFTEDAYDFHEVVVNSDGTWSFTPPRDLLVDEWTFNVRELGQSDWADKFVLAYTGEDAPTEPGTSLDFITDNKGKIVGDLQSGSFTDDHTPTLHGKSIPGSIVYIRGAFADAPDEYLNIGEARVDDQGNWQLEIQLFKNESYLLQARSELDEEWSSNFLFGIYDDAPASVTSALPEVSSLLNAGETALFSATAAPSAAQTNISVDDIDNAIHTTAGVMVPVDAPAFILTEEPAVFF